MRYQLRLSREWQHTQDRLTGKYNPTICEEYFEDLDKDNIQFIPDEEFQLYTQKSNVATQIMHTQSIRMQELRDKKHFDDFRHMQLHDLLRSF